MGGLIQANYLTVKVVKMITMAARGDFCKTLEKGKIEVGRSLMIK